jgi:hypothetical protein
LLAARQHVAARAVRDVGPGDDERHVQGRVVSQNTVRALAVLTEPLAVIGGEDDEQRRAALRRDPREEPA